MKLYAILFQSIANTELPNTEAYYYVLHYKIVLYRSDVDHQTTDTEFGGNNVLTIEKHYCITLCTIVFISWKVCFKDLLKTNL